MRFDELSNDELAQLMEEIDAKLPPCSDTAFQMVAYMKSDDLLKPIAEGKLVVIGRGMFRRIRDRLREADNA